MLVFGLFSVLHQCCSHNLLGETALIGEQVVGLPLWLAGVLHQVLTQGLTQHTALYGPAKALHIIQLPAHQLLRT
jgi:hypothetical protein